MVEINGVQYPGKSAEENTADMVAYVNDYCASHDIRNSKGEVIYIDASETNPLYMMMFGQGYLLSILQQMVQSAGAGFSIASSSDRQLLDIAEIARVRQAPATKTTIVCIIYAEETQGCHISTDLVAEVSYGSEKAVFHPAYETDIVAGGAQSILLISELARSYNIAAGAIPSFKTNPEGLRRIISYEAIPGTRQETIAEMRARIQARSETTTVADRCADAIRQLDGVSRCSVYVNESSVISKDINGILVGPRQALVLVQGFNTNIARTYYSYMLMETVQASPERTIKQDYITHANQAMPVYIIEPETVPLYMRVYVQFELDDSMRAALKDVLCENAANTYIGGSVDAAQLIKLVGNAYPVQGLELSEDRATWWYKVTPKTDQLYTYNTLNITILVSAI